MSVDPEIIKEISSVPQQDVAKKASQKTIEEIKIDDHTWRLKARKRYGTTFVSLLLVQNIVVFWMVGHAYCNDKLSDLSLVLSVIITGTLVETAYIIRIIVQWVFSNIDYKE